MNTEEKIKIEAETALLKREYKYAMENLSRIKAETNEILTTRDRLAGELKASSEELNKVLLEISDAKLRWMSEKQAELDLIADKNAQADNIIKRKAELNEQEEAIRKLEASDIEIRNETRRLELKLAGDKTALEHEKKELEEKQEQFNKTIADIESNRADFKKRVEKVLKEVDKL